MAIQDHWLINGKKYFIMYEGLGQQSQMPRTIERTLAGTHIMYTGQGTSERISQMSIFLAPNLDSSWGTIDNLISAYESGNPVNITENDDTKTYTGVILGLSSQPIAPSLTDGFVIGIGIQKFLT